MSDPKKELQQKVTRLVNERFAGDWDRAFRHYAALDGSQGVVSKHAITQILKDTNIGNGFTRGAWTSGIMKELDTNKDKGISWQEFQAIFQQR